MRPQRSHQLLPVPEHQQLHGPVRLERRDDLHHEHAFTINYDEFSYAKGVGFPVAQIQNAAGFYTIPTDSAVAVALTQAQINKDKNSLNYLSQDLSKVYGHGDPRTYPISAYSYMIARPSCRGISATTRAQRWRTSPRIHCAKANGPWGAWATRRCR
jgi:hypothetical protein